MVLPVDESGQGSEPIDELELLRSRWVDSLTGRKFILASPSMFASAIEDLDDSVTDLLRRVSPTATRFFDNRDWSLGATDIMKTNAMQMNYVDLRTLAVARATPGSVYEDSSGVLAVLKQGLEHMYTTVYNPFTTWWGNWWSWNIGASQPLADTMAILHGELNQSAIDNYCAAIDHFLPGRDPRMQAHPAGPMPSDGANRVDICRAMIVRAIVQPDTALLQDSVAALSPTWNYVDEGDGFRRDGSFIQHFTVGYTGAYGLVLLDGLSRLFALLAGTLHGIGDANQSNLLQLMDGSFAPLMYRGQIMDAVRGRAICRTQTRSIDAGRDLIDSALRLCFATDDAAAQRWRGLCSQWIQGIEDRTIHAAGDIPRLALLTDLIASDVEPVQDATGPHMFPAMDRFVHRSPSNDWALCLAMCSNRIAWSEGSPEENFNGVKTSQGMTYVYLADDDDHFDDEYWATCDLEAPAGSTVDMTPLSPNPEGVWGEARPDNEWTGGAQLADMAVAGMHLVAPGGTGLVARKTWFTLPDMVVALGADISTASTAEVRTVVEHRNLGKRPRTLLVDGAEILTPRPLTAPRWAHLQGVGGYLFFDEPRVLHVGIRELSGTWQRNTANVLPGTEVVHRRQYATLAYHHGVGAEAADSTYAYALLPNASEKQTTVRAAAPGLTILSNDATTQSIRLADGTLGATFWKPGTTGGFTSGSGLCLLARRCTDNIDIAMSDPSQQQDRIMITVAGAITLQVSGPDASRVDFTQQGEDTLLVIDVSCTAGMTLTFSLR